MRARVIPLAALLMIRAGSGAAQIIPIRTVPVTLDHQFDLFPSRSLAMGGVSIAVEDTLRDPVDNPASGVRIHSSRFFGAPGVYSVSADAGAGRSLPVGAWLRSGEWFGGGVIALQQVDLSQLAVSIQETPVACPGCTTVPFRFPPPERTNGNAYAFAMLGRTFPALGLSLGLNGSWAGLHGVDGVDLLYAGSARLRQRGHSWDVRVGGLKEWAGARTLEFVVLHNRYATTHDVYYLDGFWDPGLQQFSQRPRLEENLDHTNTWGMQVGYRHPLPGEGWRLGWVATTNLMSHPQIPNYEIQNIPRDPGNSEAFQVGVGLSKSLAGSTFGLDLVYEPIRSHTWADTPVAIQADGGATIPAGGKTIENRFRFSNAILRMGFAQDFDAGRGRAAGFQLGLGLHAINYTLRQQNHVEGTSRRLNEDWLEWTPTWGLSLRFPAWELRYRGSVTNGTGRPGVIREGPLPVAVGAPSVPGNVLVAPSGPLTLTGVQVVTHQVSIAFPFR